MAASATHRAVREAETGGGERAVEVVKEPAAKAHEELEVGSGRPRRPGPEARRHSLPYAAAGGAPLLPGQIDAGIEACQGRKARPLSGAKLRTLYRLGVHPVLWGSKDDAAPTLRQVVRWRPENLGWLRAPQPPKKQRSPVHIPLPRSAVLPPHGSRYVRISTH
jgi:hypothetical protein